MTTIQAVISREDNEANLTVSVPGDPKSPYTARSDHPNFKAMIAAVATGDLAELPPLFDVAETIALKFQRLSERVTVEDGQVLFDGTAVDSTLTQHILDVLHEGASDASWGALVNFFEKVQTNPNTESRDQLYDWIKAQDGLTITEAGDMVGYKYVVSDDTYGYRSSSSGREPVRVTFADGTSEVFTGRIPNPLGGLIEMPRHFVDANPQRTCSVGLHIGAWNYVKNHQNILEVHVNPRDVVAVPSDYNGEKVRACRYTVIGPVSDKYGQAVKVGDEAPKPDVRGQEVAPATREDLDVTLAPAREALKAEAAKADRDFAVGDRVVFNQPYSRAARGDEGVVTKVRPASGSLVPGATQLVVVKLDNGQTRIAYNARLDRVASAPVEPTRLELNVGDYVEVVSLSPDRWEAQYGAEVGKVYRVGGGVGGDKTGTPINPLNCVPLSDATTGEWLLYIDGVNLKVVTAPEPGIGGFKSGDRVVDFEGDKGTIVYKDGSYFVNYDDAIFGLIPLDSAPEVSNLRLTAISTPKPTGTSRASGGRSTGAHGKGGHTSQAAKGRGKNPDQDANGRFTAGRSNSQRDSKGRFVR